MRCRIAVVVKTPHPPTVPFFAAVSDHFEPLCSGAYVTRSTLLPVYTE